MKPRLFLLPLAAFCALLLPSCVRWNIGACIRHAAEERVGVDAEHPVGKVYALPDGSLAVRAPEVGYRVHIPLVEFDDELSAPLDARRAVDLRPTGRELLVRFHEKSVSDWEEKTAGQALRRRRPCVEEELAALPPGAREREHIDGGKPFEQTALGRLILRAERERAKAGIPLPPRVPPAAPPPTVASLGTLQEHCPWPATLAAVPFDYGIDPVLSGVSTLLGWAAVPVVGIGYSGYTFVEGLFKPGRKKVGAFEGELLNAEAPAASASRSISERPGH